VREYLRCHFLIKIAVYDEPFAADAGPRPAKNEIRGYFPVIGFIPGSARRKFPVPDHRERFITD